MMALEGYFIVLAPAILTTLLMLWIEVMPLVRKIIDTTTGSTTHLELVREICSHTAFYGSVGSYLLGTQAGSTAAAYTGLIMWALNKAALAAALLILVGVVGHFDAEDADAQHENYCSMVATWKAEARAGVPANDRTGWPPYDEECK